MPKCFSDTMRNCAPPWYVRGNDGCDIWGLNSIKDQVVPPRMPMAYSGYWAFILLQIANCKLTNIDMIIIFFKFVFFIYLFL